MEEVYKKNVEDAYLAYNNYDKKIQSELEGWGRIDAVLWFYKTS